MTVVDPPSSTPIVDLHEMCACLADKRRLAIVLLLGGGEASFATLTEALSLSQSVVSYHLAELRSAGLVYRRREGRFTYYRVRGGDAGGMAGGVASLRLVARDGSITLPLEEARDA